MSQHYIGEICRYRLQNIAFELESMATNTELGVENETRLIMAIDAIDDVLGGDISKARRESHIPLLIRRI